MASAFTAANRRKKVATYGKNSKQATVFNWDNEASSPERPRKQIATSADGMKRDISKLGAGATAQDAGTARQSATQSPSPLDIFDVPSDNDLFAPASPVPIKKFEIQKKPAKKVSGERASANKAVLKRAPPKQAEPADEWDVPVSDNEVTQPPPRKRAAKVAQAALPVAEKVDHAKKWDVPVSDDGMVAQPRRPTGRPPQPAREPENERPPGLATKNTHPEKKTHVTSSEDALAPPRTRGKTSQAPQRAKGENQPSKRQAAVKAKAGLQSRATTPAPPPNAMHTRTNNASTMSSKKPAATEPKEVDIFDVPSSGEEHISERTPRRPRPTFRSQTKSPILAQNASTQSVTSQDTDTDNSTASRKRKRAPSSQPSQEPRRPEQTKAKRSAVQERKSRPLKEVSDLSQGNDVGTILGAPPQALKGPTHSINRPQRTRTRTMARPPRHPVGKHMSSPAKLHGMLAVRASRPISKPAAVTAPPLDDLLEDETMYDISDPVTPFQDKGGAAASGSVTPRQKQILGDLVGGSLNESTPGMPSIGKLQLSERRPGGVLAALNRSSSDIPQSMHSRGSRLVDTLRQTALDAEEDDDDSGSDEQSEDEPTIVPLKRSSPAKRTFERDQATIAGNDEMDVDEARPSHSQASQSQSQSQNTFPGNSRFTYAATTRTYLEEANPEDNLLMSIDIDELLGEKKQDDLVSEDEDDPASQVRGIHELRGKGQNDQFRMEVEMSIDEIADKAKHGNSTRRSSMLAFCKQTIDPAFVKQLTDSGLDLQLYKHLHSNGEIMFDFAASAAVAFILRNELGSSSLDAIYHSDILATLTRQLDNDLDINRIAKDRKTNMSRVARESVDEFRSLLQDSRLLSSETMDKVTPRMVALKSLELVVTSLRKAGNTDPLLEENVVAKIVDIAAAPCDRLKALKASPRDLATMNTVFSILESVSLSEGRQATWSVKLLQRLVGMMSVFLEVGSTSPVRLAIRLCMSLTNNKPKACDIFAEPDFVQPLVRSISQHFAQITKELNEEQRVEMSTDLILSLGAAINLAEFSDQARASVLAGGDDLIDTLAKTFLEGSERAAQADSLEQSHTNIPYGYLAVLLGNLCLNDDMRSKLVARLPNEDLKVLTNAVREFVQYHEMVDRKVKDHFQGEEGHETWATFTRRLMAVVQRLEKAGA